MKRKESDRHEMFSENINLIYYFSHRFSNYNKRVLSFDDIRNEAAIGLWVATELYEKSKGSLGSYAGTIIKNRLIDVINKSNKCPIQEYINNNEIDIDNFLNDDQFNDQQKKSELFFTMDAIHSFMDKRKKNEKRIFYLYFSANKSVMEIGVIMGKSHQGISFILRKLLKLIKDHLLNDCLNPRKI